MDELEQRVTTWFITLITAASIRWVPAPPPAEDGCTGPTQTGWSNTGRPSVVITPACDPNAFDHDCFAEHLLNNPNGGAVAFIGNSRVGWGYQGYLYQEMFTGIYYYRQQMLGQAFSVLQHIRDSYLTILDQFDGRSLHAALERRTTGCFG